MSLIGECDDCGIEGAQLRYKPDVPADRQTRPSICSRCRHDREARIAEQRRERGLEIPPHVDASGGVEK
ncbi:hypothetical protein ACFQH2_13960 [Natronoarchaeum sp. GCM10025703]|uniref:hypothetical protein n=1 Tax=unclassified Natronoarchaeum TaxID=2620183 RepID=UPI003610329E